MWFETFHHAHGGMREAVDELRYRRQIRRHAQMLRRVQSAARKGELEALEGGLGELALFCHAAVDLMIEKGLLTREELVERMRVIDAADGEVDGRFTPPGPDA